MLIGSCIRVERLSPSEMCVELYRRVKRYGRIEVAGVARGLRVWCLFFASIASIAR